MQSVVVKINEDVKNLSTKIESLRIVDEETNSIAAELLGAVKARMKRVDELRTKFVKPLNDQVKVINNTFKIELAPLEKYEEKIKEEMKKYLLIQKKKAEDEAAQKRQEYIAAEQARIAEQSRLLEAQKTASKEEQEKLEELIQEMSVQTVQEDVEAVEKTVRTATTTVSMKTVWKYEIVDQDTLMKAYPQFFIPDPKKIQEFVMNTRVEGERDGLKIYQDTVIASR